MFLFFISFILVFAAAYLIVSIVDREKTILGLIYLPLIAFAGVVFTFEFLSLFSAISVPGVLGVNVLTLGLSAFFWNKAGRPLWGVNVKPFLRRFFNALKLDKYLAVLFAGWIVLVTTAVFLMSFLPVVNFDASAYHVLRSAFWVTNGNLNHFSIADSRNLILPINSEILYAWLILFVKKEAWFGFVSFTGYILTIVSLYNLMALMRLSMRKKLWIIFLVSSLPSTITQMSGTETDIIISGLILASIFLFLHGLKEDNTLPVFMSSLAYALAVGTKTPAIIAIPAVWAGMLAMNMYYRREAAACRRFAPFLKFLGFFAVNFLLFAAYNYVLNLIDYGNIAGSNAFMLAHRNRWGLAAIPANFIKYMFIFFDFTGFKWGQMLGPDILDLREAALNFLHLSSVKDGIYTSETPINLSLFEVLMGMGILGFLVYLPCWIWAFIKPALSKRRRYFIILAFAAGLFINILVMSAQLQFMTYSVRFLAAFCTISAPVLAYSYRKKSNPYKFIIVFFAMFYLIFVSTSLWARPFRHIVKYIKAGYSIQELRELASCTGFDPKPNKDEFKSKEFYSENCIIRDFIRQNYTKDDKILFFVNTAAIVLTLKMLEFEGYHIDFGLMEDMNNIDLNQYDGLITIDNFQLATNILRNPAKSPYTLCIYLDIHNNPTSDFNKAYLSQCVLSTEFYKNSGFYIWNARTVLAMTSNSLKNPVFVHYLFYHNSSR